MVCRGQNTSSSGSFGLALLASGVRSLRCRRARVCAVGVSSLCEIHRLSGKPFGSPPIEVCAVDALEACWSVLTELKTHASSGRQCLEMYGFWKR